MKLTEKQKQEIYQKIELGGKKIVLLDVLGLKDVPQKELNANIYCINDSFDIIWQIDPEPTKLKIDSFTSIKINEKKFLEAKRFSGFKYKIDLQSGKAEIMEWDK